MLRGLVLDFDSVVIDSESTVLASWREEYERHGLPFDLDAGIARIGTHTPDADDYAVLGALVGETFDRAACETRRRARETELVQRQPVLPGVREWLEEARALGLGTAVASSSPRSWVQPHLDRLGLAPLVDAVCTRDDVARTKPAPDLYLLAARRLGVDPSACVAVEDSLTGLQAATAAGCVTVHVPNALTAHQPQGECHHRVASLADLRLSEVPLPSYR